MFVHAFDGITPEIDNSAFIAHGACVLGDVKIGVQSSIWFGCVVRGDVNKIRIGSRTNIQDNSTVHVAHNEFGAFVGDNVTVGHNAVIHACQIMDNAFVGMQACVMDGAVVEERAMVAAGALVTPGKVIPSGELWAGRPAKFMRLLSDEDFEYFAESAHIYVELAEKYKKES